MGDLELLGHLAISVTVSSADLDRVVDILSDPNWQQRYKQIRGRWILLVFSLNWQLAMQAADDLERKRVGFVFEFSRPECVLLHTSVGPATQPEETQPWWSSLNPRVKQLYLNRSLHVSLSTTFITSRQHECVLFSKNRSLELAYFSSLLPNAPSIIIFVGAHWSR